MSVIECGNITQCSTLRYSTYIPVWRGGMRGQVSSRSRSKTLQGERRGGRGEMRGREGDEKEMGKEKKGEKREGGREGEWSQ